MDGSCGGVGDGMGVSCGEVEGVGEVAGAALVSVLRHMTHMIMAEEPRCVHDDTPGPTQVPHTLPSILYIL